MRCVCLCAQTFFSHACGPDVDKSSELRTWAPVEPVKKPGTILDWAQASTCQTNTRISFTSESQNALSCRSSSRRRAGKRWMCRMLIAVIWRVHGGSFPHYHHFQNITIHLQWLRRAHVLTKPPVTGHSGPAVTTIVEFKKMSVDLWGHFLWFSY